MDIVTVEDLLCRLCAKSEDELICLTSEDIIEKIYQCTSVIIKNDIGLPYYICSSCQQNILNFFDFRDNCIKTQTFLINRSTTNPKINVSSYFEDCSETEETIIEESFLASNDHKNQIIKEEELLEKEEEELLIKKCKEQNKTRQTKQLSEEQRKSKYKALLRPCDMCGKMVEKSRMQSHINQHLGVQPYICDIENCDKSFYCPYMLTNHKRNHHSNNNYCCEICGKSYRLQKSLYNHKQKHKEPRYICKICGRKYKNSTYLKQHTRSHTGERPYQCPNCPRAFATSYNLKAHIRSHTKEKPYVCSKCGVAYGYNSLLKAHTEKCHLSEEQFLGIK